MNEQRVRIVQWLCPQRHCFVAVAYESANGEADPAMTVKLREGFEALIKKGAVPSCGICASGDFHAEDSATPYTTSEEAMPALRKLEREQLATRAWFRASRG